MSTTLDILVAARAKIAQGWCQGAYAKDAKGEATESLSPDAERWCSAGAITASTGANDFFAREAARDAFVKAIDAGNLALWNDAPGRTQAEVLAVFDEAIRRAGGQ